MAQHDKRLSYGALKRQFDLDDAYLEDVKLEIIEVRHQRLIKTAKCWSGLAQRKQLHSASRNLLRQPDGLTCRKTELHTLSP